MPVQSSSFRFKTAIAATGLAVALVGCGGSDEKVTSEPTTTQPTTPPIAPGDVVNPATGRSPNQDAAILAARTTFQGVVNEQKLIINDSESTNEEKLAAHKAVKTAAATFLDVLNLNNGSAEDSLMATKAYSDADDAIPALETAIANQLSPADAKRVASAWEGIDIDLDEKAYYKGTNDSEITFGSYSFPLTAGKDADDNGDWEAQKFTKTSIEAYTYSLAPKYEDIFGNILARSAGGIRLADLGGIGYINHLKMAEPQKEAGTTKTTTGNSGQRAAGYANRQGVLKANDGNTYKWYDGFGSANAAEVKGTLYGVPGTFTCVDPAAGAYCMVKVTPEGTQQLGTSAEPFGSGDVAGFVSEASDLTKWKFTPTKGSSRLNSLHASYGWWIEENGDDWTISVFNDYKGNELFELDTSELIGRATYKGDAAGRYAIKDTEEGMFTATAELTADFRQSNEISGKIHDFMAGGVEQTWQVELKKGDIDSDGEFDGDIQLTMDDKSYSNGEWSGSFHGFNVDQTVAPALATGIFSANSPEIRMVGGFGTELDEIKD